MGEPVVVRDPEQVGRVVDIMVSAFFDDPTWSHAFPDAATRRAHHRWLWGLAVGGAVRYPFVWLSGNAEAAAVWIPPGELDLSPSEEVELETGLLARLGAGAPRVIRAFELFAENRPTDEPHYYLTLLGTDVAHRGQGHGLALLAYNLAEIDATRSAAYLEASNPANVRLYQRYGFEVRGAFDPFEDGPTVMTMWREARP